MDVLSAYLDQTADAFIALRTDTALAGVMHAMAGQIEASFRAGGKLLICGNGGSAGDAQHIAGEIVGRFMYDRPPLPAIALTTDGSVLTAIANDYGYDQVFERQVLGLGKPGDVLLAISTSGNSPGILRALDAAQARSMLRLGFSGAGGGAMAAKCDHILRAPSPLTPIVQQIHITAAHAVCALVERAMFPQ